MNENAIRFRVGVFVLSMLILLAFAITLFGGLPTMFKIQKPYTILFDSAPGVGPGTPVRRSGVRIGEVQNVELEDATGLVRVYITVERRYTIRDNEAPMLMQSMLGGDTSIDFVPRQSVPVPVDSSPEPAEPSEPPGKKGNPPPPPAPLPPGSEIQGFRPPDVRELVPGLQTSLQRFDRMTPQIEAAIREFRELGKVTREMLPELRRTNDEILVTAKYWSRVGERMDVLLQTNQDKLIKALDDFSDTIVRVGNVFNEENQKNLNLTLRNVRAGSDNLESITKNTDEMIKESRQTIQRINNSVKQADEVLNNLQQTTKPMAERSDKVMKNLDESTEKLNMLINEARSIVKMFQGEGSFRSLATDPALYNNLNDAACMITRILPRVDRALRDVEVFADKIARHPEALGVGGVVVPGSGLKR